MIRDKGDAFVQEMKSGRNLNVMTFNIWRGSTSIDQVAEAIRTAEADVIGIQEADGQLPVLARKLNYYYDEGHSILSRYPLHQSAHKEFIWVEVALDEAAAMSNVHLCHEPYGPYDIRDGLDAAAAVENENQIHMQEMNNRFHLLGQLASQGVPVFLTGDFNVPSHLDWTDEAKGMHFGVAVEWPVSTRLEQLQLRDSYRDVYPDPLARPAATWTAGENGRIALDEVHDRIDFVYAGGAAVTIDSKVIGEKGMYSDIGISPWPSDHRAVVSTFVIAPVSLKGTMTPKL